MKIQRWEYKEELCYEILEEFLNKFGEQGWEVIQIEDQESEDCYLVIFKRPKL